MWKWKLAQAAEIRWWRNYLKNKTPLDYLQWKRNYWKDFLSKYGLEIRPDARCLDAGCSLAGIFIALDNQQVTAIDPLLEQYETHLGDFFDRKNYPNVEFKNIGLENLSDEGIYDEIFCLNVINHVKDIKLSTQKLWQSLKVGGRLSISVDAHNHRLLKRIFQLLPGDILHPHQLDKQNYQQLFADICQQPVNEPILIKKERIFSYWLFVITKM